MTITNNSVVSFHYTVKDEGGEQLDSSAGGQPLTYLHGANNIIPGLEQALEGKQAGESLEVTIPPEQAYGDHQEGLVQTVPKDVFQGAEVSVGQRFEAQTDNGPITVVVAEIEGDNVTVDGNHPLAGKSLSFSVTVEEVRDATEEEVAHGHVHGAGGHEH